MIADLVPEQVQLGRLRANRILQFGNICMGLEQERMGMRRAYGCRTPRRWAS